MGAIFSRRLRQDQYAVIFYRRLGVGPWRAWYPSEELSTSALQPGGRLDLPGAGIGGLRREDLGAGCKEEELGYALRIIQILNDWGGMLGFFYERMIGEKLEPIEAPSDEWLRTFESYSTDLPSGAPELAAALDVSFPGRKESRTVVQTLVQVEAEGATLADLAGARSYAFELIGEVLRADADTGADRLFESFRYRFEFPVEGGEATGESQPAMPLVAQRYLRPGEYKLILRVDDLNGDAVWRHAEPLEVPRVEAAAGWTEADLEPIFAEANRSLASGEPTIRIIPPGGELVSGYLRFDTAVTGPVDRGALHPGRQGPVHDQAGALQRRRTAGRTSPQPDAARDRLRRRTQPDRQRLLPDQRFSSPLRRPDHRTDPGPRLQQEPSHAGPGHRPRGPQPGGAPGLPQRGPGGHALRGAFHRSGRTARRTRTHDHPDRGQAARRRRAGGLRRGHGDHQRTGDPRRSAGRLRRALHDG